MFPICARIEAIVGIEVRDRKRQQAARDARRHVGRCHCRTPAAFRILLNPPFSWP
jgi:hypothetical protein